MAKVSIHVAFTLNLGNYQSAKYEYGVDGIDTEAPLQPQLDAAQQHVLGTAEWVENHLAEKMRADGLITTVRERRVG